VVSVGFTGETTFIASHCRNHCNKSKKQFVNYTPNESSATLSFMQATAQSQPHNVRHTHTGLCYYASAASAACVGMRVLNHNPNPGNTLIKSTAHTLFASKAQYGRCGTRCSRRHTNKTKPDKYA